MNPDAKYILKLFLGMAIVLLLLLGALAMGAFADQPTINAPKESPQTPQAVALGRELFADPIVSSDGTYSCKTCHQPTHRFSDANAVSIGTGNRKGVRHVLTLYNVAYLPQGKPNLTYDGHAVGIEGHIGGGPIVDQKMMAGNGQTLDQCAARVDTKYHARFVEIYGTGATSVTLPAAISAYLRTLIIRDSPMQRFDRGEVWNLDERQQRGEKVFTASNCRSCHSGQSYTDGLVHSVGISSIGVNGQVDNGAGDIFGAQFNGKFKTPTLLGLGSGGPYTHAGALLTLDAVVEYFNHPNQTAGCEIGAQNWTAQQKSDLVYLLTTGFQPSAAEAKRLEK